MKVVAAAGGLLEQILDQTYPVWGEGLAREAYGKYNRAQAALTRRGRAAFKRGLKASRRGHRRDAYYAAQNCAAIAQRQISLFNELPRCHRINKSTASACFYVMAAMMRD